MFSVHRVRLLREVQLRGSLAAAAAALGYDPSTLSQQLKVLEREVGAPLLERVGRGVRLTAAGVVLVRHGEVVLRAMEEAEAGVAAVLGDVSGLVRVASFQTAAHAFVVPAIAALAEHPALEVRLSEFDAQHAVPALIARDVDLVLEEAYPGHSAHRVDGVEREPLGADRLLLLDARGRALSELAESPWAMEPRGTLARAWAVEACRAAGFEPRVAFDTSDVALQVRIAAEGLAVALVPELGIPAAVGLRGRELPDRPERTLASAVRSGSGGAPAILAVRRALREQFRLRSSPS